MKRFYTGIDIGTYHVKVVIAEPAPDTEHGIRILGVGSASSKGMRHGYIVNTAEATQSITDALTRAQEAAKVSVKRARIGIGGIGLDELKSVGEVSLTASGGEVTTRDLERALADSERRASSKLVNKKVIHAIPLTYHLDGKPVLGRPHGLQGSKLTVETLLITALEQHLNDIIEAVETAGVEAEDVMAAPLAASLVTLTKPQKMAGVVLANIGAETLSIAVFENDQPLSVKILPTGAGDVTNDLALAMKVPLTEAEQMKRGALTKTDVSRKKVDDVVSARLKDMFGLIDAHLKAIGKHKLLPAGIVITGGGSGLTTARDIARATLKLPSQVTGIPAARTAADATWAVAFGLCKWEHTSEQKMEEDGLSGLFAGAGASLWKGIRSLLP